MIVVAVHPTPLAVSTLQLVGSEHEIYGHASGSSYEVAETLRFAALTGLRLTIE